MPPSRENHPDAVLATPPPRFSPRDAERIAREIFGVAAAARELVGERDQNFRLRSDGGEELVLEIANAAQDPAVVDFQVGVLRHIAARDPALPVPRVRETREGTAYATVEAPGGTRHTVSLLTYLPGRALERPAGTRSLRRRIGELNARLGRALRGYFHPAAGHTLLWDVKHVGRLRERAGHIQDAAGRRRAGRWLDRIEARLLPVLPGLRAQVIHNDMHPDNILVDGADPERITGIIDFGDMVHTALANDPAVAAAHHFETKGDPIDEICDIVAAYHSVTPLEEEEIAVLFDLIAARVLITVSIPAWRAQRHPANRDYLLNEARYGIGLLERLDAVDPEAAGRRIREACAPPGRVPAAGRPAGEAHTPRHPATDDLLARRRRLLGPSYELFYDTPLHLVRGEGAFVYDADGRAYLDAYNNVPHVGHGHPRVTAALDAQARTLNTHTRYLDRTVLDYAEKLTATLPGELKVCMFVCTGSEANDLAWRLARARTGGDGAIVTRHAYHGNTAAISRLSIDDFPPEERAGDVRTVPAPDLYRGPYRRGDPDAGRRYADCLDEAIEALRADGHRPAMFLFDSIFESDGIFVPPGGYLRDAFRKVRAAGGLCVADEVQAGFGRTGTHMWGFAAQEVVPDIVTLGKPMGNGHPLAAVITTPGIASGLEKRGGYFNTFGGNPVSCAVGLAVLEVLESEALQDHARRVGAHMKKRLDDLADKHALIGDVRGAGLFLGVELVRDRATLAPATTEARTVINRMRANGVLIGLTGAHANVLKIRPPMVFTQENADQLVDALDRVLDGL